MINRHLRGAAGIAVDAGCEFAIVGHSERRTEDHVIDRKAQSSFLKPIFCMAKPSKISHFPVIERQIKEGLNNFNDIKLSVIAYEPVWQSATAGRRRLSKAHAYIRAVMRKKL